MLRIRYPPPCHPLLLSRLVAKSRDRRGRRSRPSGVESGGVTADNGRTRRRHSDSLGSTPGTTFLPSLTDAVSLARDVNDYLADLVAAQPDRFGFFATVPTPHVDESAAEVVRSLDELGADGVVLLANSAGTYLGQEGQDELFAALDARSAVVFIHPAELPGPAVDGVLPFATDFLLDTTRAAYLLVRNEICRRYPEIRFILSHAGGFVPYASHRMAVGIMSDTGRSPTDSLDDFAGFYFDTALSSSAAALPSLLAFAKPGHVTFGSDWPFAPIAAGKLFAAGLETYPGLDTDARAAIERTNALCIVPAPRDSTAAQCRLHRRSNTAHGQQSGHARRRATDQHSVARLAHGCCQATMRSASSGPLSSWMKWLALMRACGWPAVPGMCLIRGRSAPPEERVAIPEDGQARFLPLAQGFPRGPVGRNRRIVGRGRHQLRERADPGLIGLVGEGRVVAGPHLGGHPADGACGHHATGGQHGGVPREGPPRVEGGRGAVEGCGKKTVGHHQLRDPITLLGGDAQTDK